MSWWYQLPMVLRAFGPPTVLSSVFYVLILARFTLTARRFQLPVVAFTTLVGAALGTLWQWFWSNPVVYGVGGMFLPPGILFNPVPTLVGFRLAAAASKWFVRSVPDPTWSSSHAWRSTTMSVSYTPWVLQYPQNSIILSGVLWGLVGLIVGMVAARRWAHE